MAGKPQRPRAGTAGAVFDIGPTPYHPIVRWQDQQLHYHSHSLPGGGPPDSSSSPATSGWRAEPPRSTSLGVAALQSQPAPQQARPRAWLEAPAHARSWYTSETLTVEASHAAPPPPYPAQAGLQRDPIRDTVIGPRASVNTVEIESWLSPSSQPQLPLGPARLSKVAPANARSDVGHQQREGPTLATPQAYMASSPASFRSAAPFTQHHTLGLPTPPMACARTRPPPLSQSQRAQRRVNVPRSPLHGRFVPARTHGSSPVVGRHPSPTLSGVRHYPEDPFQALHRPSVVGGCGILPSPSFAQRHAYSGSATSLVSNVSADSRGIPRKATKILGLPPPPDSTSLAQLDAEPPRPGFIAHGGGSSAGSLSSARSPSTASQMNSALLTPALDSHSPSGVSPGHPARNGFYVEGGGGQPVPTKAQRLLGLMPTKAQQILGVAQTAASSSGHDSSEADLDLVSSESSWDATEAYGEEPIAVNRIPLEPPKLPDLRPPSGSFQTLLLSMVGPTQGAQPQPRPGPRRINALSPNARESHFLPGSPVLIRKNSKRLRLRPSNQSLRQQAARYTILSAILSPHTADRSIAPKTSMKSLRSAASAQMHVLAVSPVPPELKQALAQAHGAVKTLEEWERDGWSDHDGSADDAAMDVGELMLFSPATTEESGEIVQAAVCRLSRAVSLADISEAAAFQTPPPAVPPLPAQPLPVMRSDTTTSVQTQSSFNSTFSCSQPTILLRTSSGARPKRLLHHAPLPVELVFSAKSPTFYLSARKYTTLFEFLSSSPSTTFRVATGFSNTAQAAKRVVYVTLSEASDTYGLASDTADDETFTLSFALHPKRIVKHSNAQDATSLGVGILGQTVPHQVARVVMRSHETIGDLLLRLSAAQVGLFAPDA